MSNHAEDVEILSLRHQIGILDRQLRGDKPLFAPVDRAFLAALLHRLPRDALGRLRPLGRPDTVLRGRRDLIAGRHARISRPKRPGHPPTITSIGRTGDPPTTTGKNNKDLNT